MTLTVAIPPDVWYHVHSERDEQSREATETERMSNMMEYTGMNLEVKDWFIHKKADELNVYSYFEAHVWAILKETEKAVYAIVEFKIGTMRTFWIPKSAIVNLIVAEDDPNPDCFKTYRCDDYAEAKKALVDFWHLYE